MSNTSNPVDHNTNIMDNTSDVWSSLVVNITSLLVLLGEAHIKAYFKIMHRKDHFLMFATSPIGLVSSVTTLIRLSGPQFLRRLIGKQFEPRADVLLDVTSVSSGSVALELIGGRLEQSVRPSTDNIALFWIHGERSGTADEVISWCRRVVNCVHQRHPAGREQRTEEHSCYQKRAGVATVSALHGKGPGAVWIARREALSAWASGRDGDGDGVGVGVGVGVVVGVGVGDGNGDGNGVATVSARHGKGPCAEWIAILKAWSAWMSERDGDGDGVGDGVGVDMDMLHTTRGNLALAEIAPLVYHFEQELRTLHPSLGSTTCDGVGATIAHWTDVSHVLTAIEGPDSKASRRFKYRRRSLMLLTMVGYAGMPSYFYSDPAQLAFILTGFYLTSLGSFLTALLVNKASVHESVDLSCFCGTAAGFASRQNPHGIQLVRCPKKAVISRARQGPHRVHWVSGKDIGATFVVAMMVSGFIMLYLGLRASDWVLSIVFLGISAFASCMRSMLDIPQPVSPSSVPAIPYMSTWGGPASVKAPGTTMNPLAAPSRTSDPPSTLPPTPSPTRRCSFPRDVAGPFVVSNSYHVLVPDVPILRLGTQEPPWSIDNGFMRSFLLRAFQLAHWMRTRSISPFEVFRFCEEAGEEEREEEIPLTSTYRTRPVLLYCDVLVPGRVLRQPMEVLVAPADDGETALILETICVAVFAVAERSFHLTGCEMGTAAELGLSLGEAEDGEFIDGCAVHTVAWDTDALYNPLMWVAAKIAYVAMLNVAEEVMMVMAREWFGAFGLLPGKHVDQFLHSMQELKLVVVKRDSRSDSRSDPPTAAEA